MKPSERILKVLAAHEENCTPNLAETVEAILTYLDEQAQEPKALEENLDVHSSTGSFTFMCRKCPEVVGSSPFACNRHGLEFMIEMIPQVKAKPQEEPKEEAIRYLKLILPMAKGYAAKNDAGSNQAYIEEVERFIKSQE